VRRSLPLLLDTIDFQATDAGMPILDPLEALRQIPTGRGLSRQSCRPSSSRGRGEG
jgi:hypothetical protein